MVGPKQPNISENSDFLYTPNNNKIDKVIPNEPQLGGVVEHLKLVISH